MQSRCGDNQKTKTLCDFIHARSSLSFRIFYVYCVYSILVLIICISIFHTVALGHYFFVIYVANLLICLLLFISPVPLSNLLFVIIELFSSPFRFDGMLISDVVFFRSLFLLYVFDFKSKLSVFKSKTTCLEKVNHLKNSCMRFWFDYKVLGPYLTQFLCLILQCEEFNDYKNRRFKIWYTIVLNKHATGNTRHITA